MTSQSRDLTKPRLLVLASTYPRWKDDAEPAFVHELCRRLVGTFDVVVVCPAAPGTLACEDMDGVRVQRFRYAPRAWQLLVNDGGITTNLKLHPWKYLLVPSFVLAMLVSTIVELWRWRPDALHAHWLLPQAAIAACARWFARGNPRLVVTSHGADIYGWKSWPLPLVKRWVAGQADALTVVSKAVAQEALYLGIDSGRIHVEPMGVDLTARFRPDPGVQRNAGEILFVGRLVEKKGLRYLIAAMPAILAEFPRAKLLVAGFGPEDQARREQVLALGLQDSVHFIGPVPQAELPALYRRAAVFVAPFVEASGGDRDGLGLVLIEAAGCGCPVVVSEVPAVRDVFKPGEAVVARPADSTALAAAIVRLLRNPGSHSMVSTDSLTERFDWASVTRRYAEILSVPAQ